MSKNKYTEEQFNCVKELVQTGLSVTAAAQKMCNKFEIPYKESIGRSFRNKMQKEIKVDVVIEDSDVENTTSTETIQYANDKNKPARGFTAIDDNGSLMSIERYCEYYGLDVNTIRSYKLISHTSVPFFNIVFTTSDEDNSFDIENSLEELVQKYILPTEAYKLESVHSDNDYFDRLVYTDVHIAMDVQGYGDPLYDGKWDREEILLRLDKMVDHVIKFRKGKDLYIDELGDFLDGLGGETTRKGHKLPQNMNDKEAFELALDFKIYLVEKLLPYYNRIVCNIITNDNHSGVFGFFAAFAVKKVLEVKYPEKVSVNVLKRFMEHYSVGKHTFINVHGKDMGEQRFGMKPKLDAVLSEKIDQYCKEHNLYNGNFIELSKGDSHQAIYDDTTSNDFSYYNYPAFSPPSNWVKTNFKLSKSGFRLYNIHRENNIKIAIPYWF